MSERDEAGGSKGDEGKGAAAPRTRRARSARFHVLRDSEDLLYEQDYICLDVPPSECRALFDKVKAALDCAEAGNHPANTRIGVYIEVQPERQRYTNVKDGSVGYPESLLRDDIDPVPAATQGAAPAEE